VSELFCPFLSPYLFPFLNLLFELRPPGQIRRGPDESDGYGALFLPRQDFAPVTQVTHPSAPPRDTFLSVTEEVPRNDVVSILPPFFVSLLPTRCLLLQGGRINRRTVKAFPIPRINQFPALPPRSISTESHLPRECTAAVNGASSNLAFSRSLFRKYWGFLYLDPLFWLIFGSYHLIKPRVAL